MLQVLFGSAALYLYWLLYVATSLGSAFYVYQDAIRQPRRALNISPYWWAAFALIRSIWTLAAYWLMQHSSLAKTGNESSASTDT